MVSTPIFRHEDRQPEIRGRKATHHCADRGGSRAGANCLGRLRGLIVDPLDPDRPGDDALLMLSGRCRAGGGGDAS